MKTNLKAFDGLPSLADDQAGFRRGDHDLLDGHAGAVVVVERRCGPTLLHDFREEPLGGPVRSWEKTLAYPTNPL